MQCNAEVTAWFNRPSKLILHVTEPGVKQRSNGSVAECRLHLVAVRWQWLSGSTAWTWRSITEAYSKRWRTVLNSVWVRPTVSFYLPSPLKRQKQLELFFSLFFFFIFKSRHCLAAVWLVRACSTSKCWSSNSWKIRNTHTTHTHTHTHTSQHTHATLLTIALFC